MAMPVLASQQGLTSALSKLEDLPGIMDDKNRWPQEQFGNESTK